MNFYKISVKLFLSIILTIMLLLPFTSCSSLKTGYVFENGTWNYVSYDTGVGRRVTPIDVNKGEFKLLDYKDFARDNKYVYFKSQKIENSHPDTFEVISTKENRGYAKDKNNVYIYLKNDWSVFEIFGADPDSFEVLDFPYSIDKNDAYNGCLPLFVDDVSEFEVVEGGNMAHIVGVDSFFESELNHIKYNEEKYGFIKNTDINIVIYSDEGKAKTNNLAYEGYMLTENKEN